MYGMDLSIPLAGMSRAEQSLNTTASQLARMPLSAPQAASPGDTVDLSAEMIALMQSRNDFETNVKVAQTFDEMQQSLLNVLG
jgi:flagellar basal body rod protein FlgB